MRDLKLIFMSWASIFFIVMTVTCIDMGELFAASMCLVVSLASVIGLMLLFRNKET